MTEPNPPQSAFRDAMASLAAAVSIVTTAGPGGRGGITVSAVCSVTDSPPTMLVCVNRRSGMHSAFVANGRLAVNLLAGDQAQMALHFAGATKVPMQERLAWDEWTVEDELPVLRGAAARLTGRIVADIERGTHSVFFVELDRMTTAAERAGLAYFRRTFVPLAAPGPGEPGWRYYDEWSDPGAVSALAQPINDEAFRTGAVPVQLAHEGESQRRR